MSKAKIVSGLAGAVALAAVALVVPFEGKHNAAYLDPPGIPTICYGHTGDVKLGDTATDTECETLLREDLAEAADAVDRLAKVPMPDTRRAAFISFVYNAGAANFARSTMLKKLNAGDAIGACNELPKWVYAGGKKLNGLVRRREAERKLCLQT